MIFYHYIIYFFVELDALLHRGRPGSLWKAGVVMTVLQVWVICSVAAWIKVFSGRLYFLNAPIGFIFAVLLVVSAVNGYVIDKNQADYNRLFSTWPSAKRRNWSMSTVGLSVFLFSFNLYSAVTARG